MKNIVLFALLIVPLISTSEVGTHSGLYRKFEKISVFWPCSNSVPHFVVIGESATPGLKRKLNKFSEKFITIDAELSSEKQGTLDGTAVFYRLRDDEENIGCVTHKQ